MLTILVKIRDGKEKLNTLREKGGLPAVLYGHGVKNLLLSVSEKEFEKIYKQAGQSSLITLEIKAQKEKPLVLIHETQKNPLTDKFIHIDFYQPSLKEKTEARIPLVFEGIAPAVKELSGTLIKSIQEIEVRAFPQDLPREIKVNIECLKTFENNILVKDLKVEKDVEILQQAEEIVASVAPPTKVEEELEKPIEENVEEVEKAGEEKPEKNEDETTETNA
ncbi:50S ribosomal protein L25 [Candidatus Parcubacteria bacterium]|nr:50S ribosomal protein L25 [Candidatus Parcubacteria bacterium]